MRRQVKPFVTEYRGAPRRLKDQASPSDLSQEPQPASQRGRAFSDAQRVFQPDPYEDPYEAALRAADALFAAPASRERPAESVDEPTRPDLRSTERDERAYGAEAIFRNEAIGGSDVSPSPMFESGDAPRRILQAIEPPTEDRFAAMEAERAPKRRGRKPGSKNKPKPVAADDWAAAAPAHCAPSPVVASPVPGASSPSRPALAAEPAFLAADIENTGDLPVPAMATRPRGERFGRKRAELRPGERWKRRLPKVAW